MSQAHTYFSEYTTGVQPSDWTARWSTAGSTWAVQEASDDIGGKHLQHDRTTTARRLLTWDTPDGGSAANVELLVRWRSNNVGGSQIELVGRASGAAGSENAYLFRNFSSGSIGIYKLVSGSLSTAVSPVLFSLEVNTWYWIRFRINGSDLKAKIWQGDHAQEPAAWTLEGTDGSIVDAGWFGVGNAASTGTRRFDAVAVGTAGDAAVFPTSEGARVTQSAVLVLGLDVPETEARVTQAAALTLAEYFAETRVTQAAVLALADHVACVTKWAECWTFTRTDGVVLGYTSHDETVVFRGVEHVRCDSLSASAVEMSSIVGAVGSIDLRGLLSDTGVSERDIYNGAYDGALIEVWMVPWENAGGEIPFRLMAGVVGANGHATATYRQELLTESTRLSQRALLEVVTPSCRYAFGNQNDPRCPVDLGPLTVAGTVDGLAIPNASTDSSRRIFTDSGRVEPDGRFALGRVTWTTGANAGAVSEVKDFVGGQFILWESLLFPIALGDQYTATPGCDKSTTAHLSFNADLVDFGGYPHLPGQDAIIRTPDAKG